MKINFLFLVLAVFLIISCKTQEPVVIDNTGLAVFEEPEVFSAMKLTESIWEEQNEALSKGGIKSYYKFYEGGNVLRYRIISFNESISFEAFEISFRWELNENNFILRNFSREIFNGEADTVNSIIGRNNFGELKINTEPNIIKRLSLPEFAFSPMDLLPVRDNPTQNGLSTITINNPSGNSSVAGVISSGVTATYFYIPGASSRSYTAVNGNYDFYFVFMDNTESLYQGNPVSVRNQMVEITLMLAAGGNYGMRRIN